MARRWTINHVVKIQHDRGIRPVFDKQTVSQGFQKNYSANFCNENLKYAKRYARIYVSELNTGLLFCFSKKKICLELVALDDTHKEI